MPRPYIRRKSRVSREAELPPQIAAFLADEASLEGADAFLEWQLNFPRAGDAIWNGQSLQDTWRDYASEVLDDWIIERPGTRPSLWWEFTAPEPRQRLGGTGITRNDLFGCAPYRRHGVEMLWIDDADVRLSKLECEPLSVDDPPLFESQSAFLERHGLFFRGERRRLAPDAFAPVPLSETAER
jgi:hypothetical protein